MNSISHDLARGVMTGAVALHHPGAPRRTTMFNAVFRIPAAQKIAQRQLEEAERLLLEHEAAAEHHDALATMYRGRIERLRERIDTTVAMQFMSIEPANQPEESSK